MQSILQCTLIMDFFFKIEENERFKVWFKEDIKKNRKIDKSSVCQINYEMLLY